MSKVWSKKSSVVVAKLITCGIVCVSVMPLLGTTSRALAQQPTEFEPVDLFPASTVFYAELQRGDQFVDKVLNHPLRRRLEEIDEYNKWLRSKQMLQFRLAVTVAETAIGKSWDETLRDVTQGGLYVGFDPSTEGVAVLVHAKDALSLERVRNTIVNVAGLGGKDENGESKLQQREYRGVSTFRINEAGGFATWGEWFLLTNKSELGKQMIDRALDEVDSSETLAGKSDFIAAQQNRQKGDDLWVFADVSALRDLGVAPALYQGKTENMLVELLFGGALSALQQTPYATSSLSFSDERLSVEVGVPFESGWVPEERGYFFGPAPSLKSEPKEVLTGTIATMSFYRDFSEYWLRAPDLYGENTNDQIAQAETQLATFFSGRDFGEEILGAIRPEVQLQVVAQEFQNRELQPAIKLPSFALTSTFKDAKTMQPQFRRIFQSLIGFLNIVGGMQGQPQLDQDIFRGEGWQIVTSNYLPEVGQERRKDAAIQYNFSPTVAFVGEKFIVSSTRELAEALVEAESGSQSAPSTFEANTAIRVDVAGVGAALKKNIDLLIAQQMLNDGKTREEAQSELGLILKVLNLFGEVELDLGKVKKQNSEQLRVKVEVGL